MSAITTIDLPGRQEIAQCGMLSRMAVAYLGPGTAPDSASVIVRVNGASTALRCSLYGTRQQDPSNHVPVWPGDIVDLRVSPADLAFEVKASVQLTPRDEPWPDRPLKCGDVVFVTGLPGRSGMHRACRLAKVRKLGRVYLSVELMDSTRPMEFRIDDGAERGTYEHHHMRTADELRLDIARDGARNAITDLADRYTMIRSPDKLIALVKLAEDILGTAKGDLT